MSVPSSSRLQRESETTDVTRAFHVELVFGPHHELSYITERDVKETIESQLRSHASSCGTGSDCPYYGLTVNRVTEAFEQEDEDGREETAPSLQDYIIGIDRIEWEADRGGTYVARNDGLGTASDADLPSVPIRIRGRRILS